MLKWVVTRRPRSSVAVLCDCNKENCHPHQLCDEANNNNHIYPTSLTINESQKATNSPPVRMGSKRTSKIDDQNRTYPANHLSFAANNTLSSFQYFLVNDHSSPLKRPKRSTGGSVSSICTATPLSPRGQCASACHRTKHQHSRRRLSSLHIREPTELASPSYRSADDPANDLTSKCTTPVRSSSKEEDMRWREIWDIFPVETVHYNEREIKTPETEEQRSNLHQGDRLVRRKAVRRRRYARPMATKEHPRRDGSHVIKSCSPACSVNS